MRKLQKLLSRRGKILKVFRKAKLQLVQANQEIAKEVEGIDKQMTSLMAAKEQANGMLKVNHDTISQMTAIIGDDNDE